MPIVVMSLRADRTLRSPRQGREHRQSPGVGPIYRLTEQSGRRTAYPPEAQRAGGRLARFRSKGYLRKGALVGLFFLIALVIDLGTRQQYSNVLGSIAIGASAVALWPWQRSLLWQAAGYAGVWLGFALVRAAAPRLDVSALPPDSAGKLERALAGGTLPSTLLQDVLYRPGDARLHDLAAIAVHVSFFVVPSVVAAALLLGNRGRFTHYWAATAIMLLLACAGFLLAPTAPPWLEAPGEVRRVAVDVAQGRGVTLAASGESAAADSLALSFDPNRLAAMPSVHVAAAVLVMLACWQGRRGVRWLGGAYALAMSVSVVYLGEHYVIDAVGGWLVAGIGWRVPPLLDRTPVRPRMAFRLPGSTRSTRV